MKKLFLLLLLLPQAFSSMSQQIRFFEPGFHVATNDTTRNIRFYYLDSSPLTVKDYAGDTLQMIASIYGVASANEADALLKYYRNNSYDYGRNPVFHNKKVQLIQFRRNGKPLRKVTGENHKLVYEQVWDEEGKEILVDGSGYQTYTDERNAEQITEVFLDYELVERYGIRPEEKDTIYYHYDKPPQPREGLDTFYQSLFRHLEYPAQAKRAQKNGRVFIRIIIDKDGELTEFIPLTDNGYRMESGVVRVLERLRPWKPAILQVKPVKSSVILPVVFRD